MTSCLRPNFNKNEQHLLARDTSSLRVTELLTSSAVSLPPKPRRNCVKALKNVEHHFNVRIMSSFSSECVACSVFASECAHWRWHYSATRGSDLGNTKEERWTLRKKGARARREKIGIVWWREGLGSSCWIFRSRPYYRKQTIAPLLSASGGVTFDCDFLK